MSELNEKTVYRTCPLCEATCGLAITISGGDIKSIQGDKKDPFSRGYICPKGASLHRLHEDPDRLRKPMIRRRDKWSEVSWDEAFKEVERGISSVFDKHGREGLAVYMGNPITHTIARIVLPPLLRSIRTRNTYSSSTVDQLPKQMVCGFMYGDQDTITIPDIDRTDYLLMIGANPLASNGSLCTAPDFPSRLKAITGRGGKVVVIDPRRTATAELASEHHFIKPGTDAFMIFAMIRTLFEKNLVNTGTLPVRVEDVNAIRHLSMQFAPEKVAPICGVSADVIERLALEFAAAEKAVAYARMGASTVLFGGLTNWLTEVLNILTGNFDRPGGMMFTAPAAQIKKRPSGGRGFQVGRWRSRVSKLPEIMGELPVAALAEEIETPGEGQIRSMLCITANPVISIPNSKRIDRAFGTLEFMVSVDFYLNETSRHANVILPPSTHLSQGHYDFIFNLFAVRNIAKYSSPVFQMNDGEMSFWEIITRLTNIFSGRGASADTREMDDNVIRQMIDEEINSAGSEISGMSADEILAALEPRTGAERILDLKLRAGTYGDCFGKKTDGLTLDKLIQNPHGMDLGPLMPGLPGVLSTPSGMIELAPSYITADVERLASFMKTEAEVRFKLIGRRDLRSNNSWMHNIDVLVSGKPRCTLQIHPADARRLDIKTGDTVSVKSRVGSVRVIAEETDTVMPGVVSLPHGWGHDLDGIKMKVARENAGVNSNIIADETLFDTLSGTSVLNGIPVEISRMD